ncbi:MAG: hypothetical protein MUC97_12385 [Bernardetiaceae bacterium]|jgi:hypothetical protein|nr:hypothetical protein [Bernardetiaceae bacterium]
MDHAPIGQEPHYPLSFEFKIATIYNDFVAKDASGLTVAYVRQKLFKFKEHVEVFANERKDELLYHIRADRWLDFNTTYTFLTADNQPVGRVARKGWRSLWKASYEIYDQADQLDLTVQEANPWTKVFDSLLSELPLVGILTGYFFNPSYTVTRPDGTLVVTFSKQPSFWGRRFLLVPEADFQPGEQDRIMLGLMMMALLERRRG